jgi:hypothetical protein
MTTTRKELAWRIIVSVCLAIAVFLGLWYRLSRAEALQQVDYIIFIDAIWFFLVICVLLFIRSLFVGKHRKRRR